MSELATEQIQRRASARRASALLDEEQASRVAAVGQEAMEEKFERDSNARRASVSADLEQASRVQKAKEDEDMALLERKVNQRRASSSMDLEQVRRIAESDNDAKALDEERTKNVEEVSAQVEEERSRRMSELAIEEDAQHQERLSNQQGALQAMDDEQERRTLEKISVPSEVKEKVANVFEELQDEVDENDQGCEVDVALSKSFSTSLKISENASADVQELMEKDTGDESLRKYKLSLLGNVADVGDVNDKRKLVVSEFRVSTENKTVDDQVFNLDTDEGVATMKEKGIELKEGAGFKFILKFRVNHEILTGMKFENKLRKGIFSQTENITIGSFAPQSETYEFTLPNDGFNYAPSGMMLRGTYKARDRFVDSDGNCHLDYDYKVKIIK